MMVTRLGPTELKTSLSIDVGRISRGLKDDFIELTMSVRSSKETGGKLLKEDLANGQRRVEEGEGMMFALTSATLFTKNERKRLQSSFENTGTEGRGG